MYPRLTKNAIDDEAGGRPAIPDANGSPSGVVPFARIRRGRRAKGGSITAFRHASRLVDLRPDFHHDHPPVSAIVAAALVDTSDKMQELFMDSIELYIAEFIGTMILIVLGNGVVANVLLSQTKGHGAGWVAITAGWGFAVYVGVLTVGEISGAHLNPAVTIGIAAAQAGDFEWSWVPGYITAQMLGAIVGAMIVYLLYKSHYDATDDPEAIRGTFCNTPSIRNLPLNTVCETVATFVLVYAVLRMSDPTVTMADGTSAPVGLGSIGALRVGLVVFAIGLSLGGPTGYAINPARDLGPRIAHAMLPISSKGGSDWGYAAIPVIGPILGGLLAAALYLAF